MDQTSGIWNVCMLMGLCLMFFRMVWGVLLSVVQGTVNVLGKGQAGVLYVYILFWSYALASQTTLVVWQAQQTQPRTGHAYELIVMGLLTLYILADRMGQIWIAERKLNPQLQVLVKHQHLVVVIGWIYALANLWVWPAWGHWSITRFWVQSAQYVLSIPVLGILLGAIGLVYQLGLVRRIIKFIRIGPKGLPPFPDGLRK